MIQQPQPLPTQEMQQLSQARQELQLVDQAWQEQEARVRYETLKLRKLQQRRADLLFTLEGI